MSLVKKIDATYVNSLSGLNKKLYADFLKLMSSFNDDEARKLTEPFFRLPNITNHLEKHTRLKELANSGWFQLYKPHTLIDLRLEFLANTLEGIVKHIHFIIEYYVRKKAGDSLNISTSLGSSVNYVQLKLPLIQPDFIELHSVLTAFGKFQEIRNAVSHDQYLLVPEYDNNSVSSLIGMASNLSPGQQAIKDLLNRVPAPALDQMVKMTESLGGPLGLKSEIDISKQLNGSKSRIVYESSSTWTTLSQNSKSISVSDLTKLLNEFDDFFTSTSLAIAKDIGDRLDNSTLHERKCSGCSFGNFSLNLIDPYDCWYCGTNNT